MKKILLILLLCTSVVSLSGQGDSSALHFDFGWTRNKNVYLWPVYKRISDSCTRKTEILFPVYKHVNDSCHGLRSNRLLPFFVQEARGTNREIRIVSLYYPSLIRIQSDSVTKDRSIRIGEILPHLNLLELSRLKKGNLIYRNALFVFWHTRNKTLDYKHTLLLPVWYRIKDGSETHTLLFPLFYTRKEYAARKSWLAPTLFIYKSRTSTELTLFPVLWWRKYEQAKALTVFPLFRAGYNDGKTESKRFWNAFFVVGKRSEVSRYTYYPSIRKSNPDAYVTDSLHPRQYVTEENKSYFFPFWIHQRTHKTRNDSLESFGRSSVIFPLYWHSYAIKEKYKAINTTGHPGYDTSHHTVLFPLYWNVKNGSYWMKGIFPLYFKGRNDRLDKKFMSVSPLLWMVRVKNSRSDIRSVNFLPVFYRKREVSYRQDTVATVYTHTVLFPFAWNYSTRFASGDFKRASVIFPIVWKFSQKFNGKEEDRRFAIFPIYWRENSDDRKQVSVFPLFSYRNELQLQEKRFSITPFINVRNGENSRLRTIFPLYFYARKRYNAHAAYSGHRVLFPLVWHYWDERHNELESPKDFKTFFPLYWRSISTNKKISVVFPVYYNYQSGKERSDKLLWLLYARQKRDSLDRKIAGYGLYYRCRYHNGDKVLRIAYKVYSNVRQSHYRELSVFPFYSYARKQNEYESKGYFLNFYNRTSKKIQGTNEYYKEVRIFWFVRVMSNARYLEGKGIKGKRR